MMKKSNERKLGNTKEKLQALIEEIIYLHLKDSSLISILFPDFKNRFSLIVDKDKLLNSEYKKQILLIMKDIRNSKEVLYIKMKASFDEHEKANILEESVNKIKYLEIAFSEICLIFNNFSEISLLIDKLLESFFPEDQVKEVCSYEEYFYQSFTEIFLSDELVRVST